MKTPDISPIDESLSIIADTAQAWSGDEFPSLSDLMRAHDDHRPHLDLLVRHFTQTRHPEHELEQHLWQTVHDYLQRLDLAYAFHLSELTAQRAAMPRAVLQRLECLALLAEWHYLRYQPLTELFWRELHVAYRMAEPIAAIAGDAKTRYLQVLMLDSVNRSSMSRSRIALLNTWLSDWCKDVALVQDYRPSPYHFFVDLNMPIGARPVNQATTGGDCRYWNVESFVARLEAMRQQLDNHVLPPDFPRRMTIANAQRLTDKLLLEWSHNVYQSERRGEQRQNVMKYAQVVHGIFNVCQHVKNADFAGAPSHLTLTSDEKPAAEDSWLIQNESQFGFGIFVYADFNRWLEPGCLIAMNYDLNPDLAPVGIVRSIVQLSAHKYSVGIEVLSHTPSYVRLQQLAETDIGLERLPPLAAIFLPENDERKQPATVAMPVLDYAAAGLYELHTPQLEHVIQLGEVLEQQADWIRVGVSVAAAITL